MHKVLILGSDFMTLEVVREAHRKGAHVIVADLMETSPSKAEADEAWLVSTTDIGLLEKKCRENGVTAVMFGASDFNVGNARILCRRLGLPIYCEDDYAWEVSRNKSLFKKACREAGVAVAEDFHLTEELKEADLEKIRYPVVVKPVDKSGNRGMSYCDNREQLIEGYRKAREISENETIIVEKRLTGPEYNINYTCADGEIRLTCFSSLHNEPGELKNVFSFEYASALHLKQYLEEMNEPLIRAFQSIGCREGIVWVDAIWDETEEKFYIFEMGYRFPGVMLNVPYEKVTGFSSVRWMLECAMGISHKAKDLPAPLLEPPEHCAGSFHLFAHHNGTIGKITGLDDVMKMDNVYVDMPKREGGQVRDHARIGLFGIYGEDISEMCDTLRHINEILHIEDEYGQDLIIHYHDYDSIRKEYDEGIRTFYQ